MNTPAPTVGKWTERTKAETSCEVDSWPVFQNLFERTADAMPLLRIILENAPEAIVVFDGETGRFGMVNENAVRLFGRSREELLTLTPREVSPAFQPNGRPSLE